MDAKIKARLGWVKLYLEKQDFGYVCRHCGISRPTLRKWYRRYNARGITVSANNQEYKFQQSRYIFG